MKNIFSIFCFLFSISFFLFSTIQSNATELIYEPTVIIPTAQSLPHRFYYIETKSSLYRNFKDKLLPATVTSVKFGFYNRLQLGLDFYNKLNDINDVVGNAQIELLTEGFIRPSISAGIINISKSSRYENIYGYSTNTRYNNTLYIIGSKSLLFLNRWEFRGHLGVGNKSFSGKYFDNKAGIICGIEKTTRIFPELPQEIRFFSEFDGDSFLFGATLHIIPDEFYISSAIRGIENFTASKRNFYSSPSYIFKINYTSLLFSKKEIDRERAIAEENKKSARDYKSLYSACKESTNIISQKLEDERKKNINKTNEPDKNELYYRISVLEKELADAKKKAENCGKLTNEQKINLNKSVEHLSSALIYFYRGEYDKAKEECIISIDLYPDIALSHTRLGSIYYKLGNKKKAIEEWEKSLSIDPTDKELRERLNKLKEERE